MRKTFFRDVCEWRQRKSGENEKLNLISHRRVTTEIKVSTHIAIDASFAQQHSHVLTVLPNVTERGRVQWRSCVHVLHHFNTDHQAL